MLRSIFQKITSPRGQIQYEASKDIACEIAILENWLHAMEKVCLPQGAVDSKEKRALIEAASSAAHDCSAETEGILACIWTSDEFIAYMSFLHLKITEQVQGLPGMGKQSLGRLGLGEGGSIYIWRRAIRDIYNNPHLASKRYRLNKSQTMTLRAFAKEMLMNSEYQQADTYLEKFHTLLE